MDDLNRYLFEGGRMIERIAARKAIHDPERDAR